jgi:hypothetical protein
MEDHHQRIHELYKGEATSLVWFMNLVDVGTG